MKRVLIVDDDPDVTECLELMLQDLYEVTLAENGALGLEKLRAESFDAVVLDVMMPVLDGVAVVEALRRDGIGVPVILASAMSNLSGLAGRLGVSDFIAKPYDFDLLLHKIAHAASGPGSLGGSGTVGGSGSASASASADVSAAVPPSSGGPTTGIRKTVQELPALLSLSRA